jgi:hypothetical protein
MGGMSVRDPENVNDRVLNRGGEQDAEWWSIVECALRISLHTSWGGFGLCTTTAAIVHTRVGATAHTYLPLHTLFTFTSSFLVAK